jgi:hypothetical protein
MEEADARLRRLLREQQKAIKEYDEAEDGSHRIARARAKMADLSPKIMAVEAELNMLADQWIKENL